MAELSDENARQKIDEAVQQLPSRSGSAFGGRGIIICGGGMRYFVCAWVCINILRRHLKCTLPIQLWHLGANEMTDVMRGLVEFLQVECIDAREVAQRHPVRTLNGWELKPYAMLHSKFREVLLLDADNVPVVNPEFLFETPQYAETGAIFWPDFSRLLPSRSIWRLTGVAYRNEPEFETGQIVVDKNRCYQPLSLAMWMNEHSDYWYKHIHGDKETFHLAWRKLNHPYSMPKREIHRLSGTMCQHDFDGRRIFQHRNLNKWSLDHNTNVAGFELEDICRSYLAELGQYRRELRGCRAFDPVLSTLLVDRVVNYRRVGFDQRRMVLEANGNIGKGQDRMERTWGVVLDGERPVLEIYGDDGLTARLEPESANQSLWRGKWLIHERMPLEIQIIERSEAANLEPSIHASRY